jgi:hypothetical protein
MPITYRIYKGFGATTGLRVEDPVGELKLETPPHDQGYTVIFDVV